MRIYADGILSDSVDVGVEEYWDTGLAEHSYHEYFVAAYRIEGDVEGFASDTVGTYAGTRPPVVIEVLDDSYSLQAAINSAMDGDAVLVHPGTYTGPVDFRGRDVCLLSHSGPSETVIDGGGYPFTLIVFDSTESSEAVISGFTLTGCSVHHGGTVVCCGPDASPTIEYNLIIDNDIRYSGGCILCEGGGTGSPVVRNNTFASNTMWGDTLGLFQGGAICCLGSSPIVTANIIASNDSCGYGIYYETGRSTPPLSCNNVWNNPDGDYFGCDPGTHDFSADPLFCGEDNPSEPYAINLSSPCVPENNDCGVLIGALHVGCAFMCADADGTAVVDIDDVVFLIAYIFSGGPPPEPLESGDAECSTTVDIDDVVYLIAYIFSGGLAPCDPNGDGEPDCYDL